MPELDIVQKPKVAGYVDPTSSHARRQAKLEAEEKELEDLIKAQKGETPEDAPEDPPEEDEVKQEEETPVEAATTEEEEDEDQLTDSEKTWKKRYGDLRRHTQKEKKALEDRIEALEKGGTNQEIQPIASDEDVATWKKKYPDVAGIVEAVAKRIADERVKAVEENFKGLAEDQEEIQIEKMRTKVRKTHKDLDAILESDEFHDWVEKKPEYMQDIVYHNPDDADSFTDILTLYKAQTDYKEPSKTEKQKQKEKEAATNVGKTSSRPKINADSTDGWFRESDIAKMSDAEYEKMEPKIDEARAKGKIINDVTAALR